MLSLVAVLGTLAGVAFSIVVRYPAVSSSAVSIIPPRMPYRGAR
jgi:hypothetical protein